MVEFWSDEPLGTAACLNRGYGGDVLNSLVTAARLGSRTGFITRVGDDPFGEALVAAWRAEGVDTACAPLVPGENGVYFISLLPGGQREFSYRRAGSAASRIVPSDLEEPYIASARILLLSGITQAISATAQAATLEAARLARKSGTLVCYDPNYRAALWEQRGGTEVALAAFGDLMPQVDVLLPSWPADLDFLARVAGASGAMTGDEEAAVRWLASAMCPLVAMKLGPAGALVARGGSVQRVDPATPERIVDTTGAGDAWNGAFLHLLAAGRPAPEAARFANQVAAAKLAHRGAIPPIGKPPAGAGGGGQEAPASSG